jgi:endonuclease-3 related protein
MPNPLLSIFDALYAYYGPRNWWPAETPLEVCVGAILTQNTNWINVEKAIANLKQGDLLSVNSLNEASLERLADAIRPSGYYNIKARRVKAFVEWLYVGYGGSLENMFATGLYQLREELLGVHGIGRETCDSILLYAGNQPTFVVDAYTGRLYSRLGLISGDCGYEKIRRIFMEGLPGDAQLFNEYHALIVHHCKVFCRKRPLCSGCLLRERCKEGRDGSSN